MDDKETKRLRGLIERPKRCYLWGQPHIVTPRLIGRVFGDGKMLLCICPIMTRPNVFVVRVDTNAPVSKFCSSDEFFDLLNEIQDAQEEEYGSYHSEREATGEDPVFPIVDWNDGCSWGEPFPIEDWRVTA